VNLRPEEARDFDAIDAVVEAAFGSPVEAKLVRDIRADACHHPERALVAEQDGEIVGHVMIGSCSLVDGDTTRTIAMLSPLAVRPDRQRDGVGSALVRAAVAIADDAGEPLVILEGSPAYYGRFGFVDARTLGIHMSLPDWAPPEAGQALPLAAYDAAIRGTAVYPPPFDGID
jgi:putative acetyltransferase